ncbi:MAG TPA: hypothetical protein VFP42_11325, partial [Acidimicrobiia bacterium]|nr:hypothetical protein [Acidimicrobiia bacterium]
APSYFPILMALGIPLMFYGVIYHTSSFGKALIAVGAVVSLAAVIGWAMEPLEEPMDHASSPDGEEVAVADVTAYEAESGEAEFEEVVDE